MNVLAGPQITPPPPAFWLSALTDLAARALVVEGSESDGGEEDGDVEEDGRGHVLQQGFIAANDT